MKTDTFQKHMSEATIKYFTGCTDFELVMQTLSDSLNSYLHSIEKDCEISEGIVSELISKVWDITSLMAFLAQQYHWYMTDKQLNN